MSTTEKIFLGIGIFILVLVPVVIYHPYSSTEQGPVATSTATTATTTVANPDWTTYSDNTLTFRYPAKLSTTYIHSVDWPPRVTIASAKFSCAPGRTEMGETRQATVNGHAYCVTTLSEGAAGSTYTDYTYKTQQNDKVVSIAFKLRSVQCGNYPEPQMSACTKERTDFNVDSFVDQMAQSVVVK